MDEFYIPGFTNYLYSGEPAYGMADYTPQYIEPAYYPEAAYYPEVAYYPEQTAAPVAVEPDQPTPAPTPAPTPVEQTGMPVSVEPYVSPLEQVAQASTPLTYEQLADRRIAANTPPEGTFITAPLSNTGQATGFGDRGQTNAFQYWGGPIRVTDRKGNVLFSGEGPEAALEAVKFAQNLSDTKGANAAWDIQQGERTINPDGSVGEMRWISGPSDAKDGRGIIGDIGAFVIPAMVALATGGLSVPLQIGAAAAAGAAGNAFADRDPLAGAVTGALTAGGAALGGSQLAPALNVSTRTGTAIGSGLGATAGGLATGQSLENALLGGLASGASSYFLPGVADELGLTTPSTPSSSTGGGSGTFDGNAINVTGGTSAIGTPVSINDGSGSAPRGDTGQDTLNDIVVSATPPVSTYAPIPGLEAADILGLTGAELPPQPAPETPPEELINVTGARVPPLSLPASIFTGQPQVTEPVSTNPADGELIDVIARREPSLPTPVSTDPADGGLIDVIARREPSLPIPVPTPGLTSLDTLGFTGAELPPQSAPETLPENEIVVSGANAPSLPAYVPVSTPNIEAPGALGLTGAQLAPAQPETLPEERDIVVSGTRPVSTPITLPAQGGLPSTETPPEVRDIVVTGRETTVPEVGSIPVTPTFVPSRVALPTVDSGATQPEAPPERNTLQDIIDYLRLAGLATSTLGGLIGGGGGGGGSNFRVPGGMGALSPVFGSTLPPPNLPGGVGGGGTGARPPSDLAGQGLSSPIDYYRYGYGPEQSFFNYAPQGAPNTSQAYTGYARGGFAVEGAGDGRDDKIPALLSDGEYVIDAETVALLGNGSNKAGAELLDQFRVNVRKQKGQKLARGEFSEDAKRPEHYMAGGHA